MTADVKPTTRDYLLLIIAGVLAHPSTFANVAQYVDGGVVGDDLACSTLWGYLQQTREPSRYEALAALAVAGVADAVEVVDRLVEAAAESTPRRTIAIARALSRALVNVRRRELVKAEADAASPAELDIEAIAAGAAKRFPHTSSIVQPLTVADLQAAADESYTVIPTGFAPLDRHVTGFVVGEFHLLPARTGSYKSTFTYSLVRNQFFANAAKHRDDAWWDQFGSEWRQHGPCPRRDALMQPRHASPVDDDETSVAPHVLWFSLEEPLAQVTGRFYCDLLSIDRRKWMKRRKFRENIRQTYATEIAAIDAVLGSGRLTLVDYATRPRDPGFDAEFVEQTLDDISKKLRAWARECEQRDEVEGVERPRLCFVDYAQLINVPDDQAREEHAVLARVSTTLRKLASECAVALAATVMLLRDAEGVEPTKERIKGSSQFESDAASIVTLWPFGKRERLKLNAALADVTVQPQGSTSVNLSDTPFERYEEYEEYAAPEDDPMPEAPNVIAGHFRRALHEIRLAGEKDRFGDPAWRLRLHVEGRFARVTEALPDVNANGEAVTDDDGHPTHTSYREHPAVAAVIRPSKKRKGDSD